ncbi:MAG: dihydroorotase, partial [Planctomycetota bacterium]
FRALQYLLMFDKTIMQHCEDPHIAGDGVMNSGATATRLGLPGINHIAEELMIQRDLTLVKETGARYHVCHISTIRSVELLREAKAAGLPVTAEVCPHHLVLTEEACTSYDPNFKMNPPLRTAADRDACLQGVDDGTIDCLVSDHAPHGMQEKELEFLNSPFGIIGLETALPLYIKALIEPGLMEWPAVIERLTVMPAKIISIEKGTLAVGADADVSIIDPDIDWTIDVKQFKSKSQNSPFDGWQVTGRAVTTIVGGKVKYQLEPVAT